MNTPLNEKQQALAESAYHLITAEIGRTRRSVPYLSPENETSLYDRLVLCLLRCAQLYSPDRGTFEAYAAGAMRRECWREVYALANTNSLPMADAEESGKSEEPVAESGTMLDWETVDNLLDQLRVSARQQEIFRAVFGRFGPSLSAAAAAEKFGVNPKRIYKIMSDITRSLKVLCRQRGLMWEDLIL